MASMVLLFLLEKIGWINGKEVGPSVTRMRFLGEL